MRKFGNIFGYKFRVNENEGRDQQKQRIGEKMTIHCWGKMETILSNTLISSFEIFCYRNPLPLYAHHHVLGPSIKGGQYSAHHSL